MPANPTPQAPQNALEGGVGAIPTPDDIQELFGGVMKPWNEDVEFLAIVEECRRELLEWDYRAALARGVWWG